VFKRADRRGDHRPAVTPLAARTVIQHAVEIYALPA